MSQEPRLLLVEGVDDKHVVWAFLQGHEFEPHFVVVDEGGYETLMKRLRVRLKPGTDLERLGIIVDADADLASRWASVKLVLEKAGYSGLPARPDRAGTVVPHEFLPRLGIWIMPDNTLPGMLEDFLAMLVPPGDTLLDRAKLSLSQIPAGERRFADQHYCKALIHTWLAWQDDPGTPLGQAITKRYFETENAPATEFLGWLTRLFAE